MMLNCRWRICTNIYDTQTYVFDFLIVLTFATRIIVAHCIPPCLHTLKNSSGHLTVTPGYPWEAWAHSEKLNLPLGDTLCTFSAATILSASRVYTASCSFTTRARTRSTSSLAGDAVMH